MKISKTILIILDGWGHGNKSLSDVIYNSKTPFIDSLYKNYPNSELLTHGKHVGLPEGQMGNSEVGHLNIGAGRIVPQDFAKINIACQDNTISHNPKLIEAIHQAKQRKKPIHLIGLVSDGGIHSHQDHLYKLCEIIKNNNVDEVYIHAFTDGRDCDPKSGKDFISKIEKNIEGVQVASICGRYFAMDRDNRWERIKQSYDLLVNGKGELSDDLSLSIQKSYDKNITDEFIRPIVKSNKQGQPLAMISDGDVVICFNFRTDRCRQITNVLTQHSMPKLEMKKLDLHFTTMTNYDSKFHDINVMFHKENLSQTLGEVISKYNLKQIRIAETEKYPHVTYFFSGGSEEIFKGERRLLLNSSKVTTYDLKPEMSAIDITSAVIDEMNNDQADFICLNFANTDMVGHTGVYSAIQKAVATVDSCTGKVVENALKNNYTAIIISDHGNADKGLNSDGSANTNHSTNPVPCFLIGSQNKSINNGILADIAPTILTIMGLQVPDEMTGKILIK
jgi:2,3-bisphosphoglycerate-independent phosphoglycerate mutase